MLPIVICLVFAFWLSASAKTNSQQSAAGRTAGTKEGILSQANAFVRETIRMMDVIQAFCTQRMEIENHEKFQGGKNILIRKIFNFIYWIYSYFYF
jgi:hypothetical protein